MYIYIKTWYGYMDQDLVWIGIGVLELCMEFEDGIGVMNMELEDGRCMGIWNKYGTSMEFGYRIWVLN